MTPIENGYSLEIGGAKLTVDKDILFRTWLEKYLGRSLTNSVVVPRIGSEWPDQGGIYAGAMRGEGGKPDYHVIVPTHASASIKEIGFGGYGIDTPGAKSEFDGLLNTTQLCDSGVDHPAAQRAKSLSINGFSDFYLPARRELSLLFANVPELFEKVWHWSSTQLPDLSNSAFIQGFLNGTQSYGHKNNEFRGRVIRRFPIF